MFVHIGLLPASMILLSLCIMQVIVARLNLECTRLQRENINFARNEDFETLISAPRVQGSWLVNYFSKLYPAMLVLSSAVAIVICCLIADDLASAYVFKDEGSNKFLFGLLPALNEKRRPVANTELIKMSRGFVFVMILAFVIGIVACFFETNQFRKASGPLTSIKIVAILALLTSVILSIPQGIFHNILDGDFKAFSAMSSGTDASITNCVFYIGVVAFGEGLFPLKVPAIASSHRRSDLPLAAASIAGAATRWLFCILAGLIMSNGDKVDKTAFNYAIIGVAFYIFVMVLPDIIDGQIYV